MNDIADAGKNFYQRNFKSMIGTPSPDVSGLNPETLNPLRTMFYQQYLSGIPEYWKVLKTYNNTARIRATWNNAMNNIRSSAHFLKTQDDKDGINAQIASALSKNTLIPKTISVTQPKQGTNETETTSQNTSEIVKIKGGAPSFYTDEVDKFEVDMKKSLVPNTQNVANFKALKKTIEDTKKQLAEYKRYNKDKESNWDEYVELNKTLKKSKDDLKKISDELQTSIDKDTTKKAQLEKLEDAELDKIVEHPFFSPKLAETTVTDRIIFIALTYVIRTIVLFAVDWALQINMIASFQETFFMYIIMYILLFFTIVLLVNTEYSEQLNPFKLIFYYLNSDLNGYGRIILHIVIQLFLIPIIFIAKDKTVQSETYNSDAMTFDTRQQYLGTLTRLSLFLWMVSSIIAIRV
jgi:hypothetical protein